jgi:hypothetical protein
MSKLGWIEGKNITVIGVSSLRNGLPLTLKATVEVK